MNPDPPAYHELERLADDSGWVEGLARRLVRDAHTAEDLVQDAWLEALTRGSHASESLSAWMAGVVKNLARGQGRSAARRSRRERAAARDEAVPSVVASAEALEQQALLIQAVLGLREPYRAAILMRFIEERQPREIAELLGVPISTVNSRLTRGLDFLREELVRSHGGDRERWLAAMVPLCGLPTRPGMALLGVTLMNSKLVLSAALLLVLCGALWLRGRAEPAPGGPGLEEGLAGLELSAVEELSAVAPSPELVESGGLRARTSAATGPEAAAEDTILFRLIDGRAGTPVAGAVLFVDDFSRPGDDRAQLLEYSSLSGYDPGARLDYLRQRGAEYESDEQGELRVPRPQRGFEALAQLGELTGYEGLYDEIGDVVEVRLWPRAHVGVQVRDEQGNPLPDVQVAVRSSTRGLTYVVERGRTDGSGRAGLRPWLVEDERMPADYLESLDVVIDTPFEVAPAAPLVLDAESRAEVELVCPSHGALVVELRAGEDEAMPEGSLVFLETLDPQRQSIRSLFPGIGAARVVDGLARFDHVGLGQELELVVPFSHVQDAWRTHLAGPESAGEEVRLRVVVGVRSHVLTGRLRGPSGQFLSEEQFRVTYDSGNGSGHQWVEECDAEGGFRLEISGLAGEVPGGELRFRPGIDPESRVETTRTLEDLEGAGPHDLGTIDFAPEPLPMCAGVVLDPGGQPVADAWVSLGNRADGELRQLDVSPARTDAMGRFTLYGEFPQEDVWLGVYTQGRWRHEPERVFGPSSSLEVWLLGSASVTGRILVDETIDTDDLVLSFWNLERGPSPSRQARGWRSYGVEPDGSFEIRGIEAGSYDVAVDLADNGGVLVELERIELREDGLSDPRLERIDLRGRLRQVDVHVLSANGMEVIAGIWFLPAEGRPLSLGRGPRVLLPVEAEGTLIGVIGPGLPATARLSDEERFVLRSPAGLELELTWGASSPVASADVSYEVEFEPLELDGAELDRVERLSYRLGRRRAGLSPGSSARVILPGAGRYRLRWSASSADGSQASTWQAPEDQGGILTVNQGQQELRLAPDAEWAAAPLARR